jgi:hypothetical protein
MPVSVDRKVKFGNHQVTVNKNGPYINKAFSLGKHENVLNVFMFVKREKEQGNSRLFIHRPAFMRISL